MVSRKLGYKVVGALTGILAIGAAAFEAHAAVPSTITQQGLLLDPNNDPVTGQQTFVFAIYDAATGGNALWTETQTITLDGGYFSTQLGSVTPIPTTVFDGSTRYLAIKIGSDAEMSPRESVTSVPYAMVAGDATGDINPTSITINGTKVVDGTGHWVGSTTGLAGGVGPTGSAGAAGPDGSTGPRGPTGAIGPNGSKGGTGAMGPGGPQGAAGAKGLQGPTGPAGADGAIGATGAAGAIGAAGPKGAAGAAGAAGATGAVGAAGPAGANGASGTNGTNGINGVAGGIGPAGPNGAAGAAGAAGATGPGGTYKTAEGTPSSPTKTAGLITPISTPVTGIALPGSPSTTVYLSGTADMGYYGGNLKVQLCYSTDSGTTWASFTQDSGVAFVSTTGLSFGGSAPIARNAMQTFSAAGTYSFALCGNTTTGGATGWIASGGWSKTVAMILQ